MGAAGDMLMASLLELMDNKEAFINRLNNIGIPNVNIRLKKTTKCGIAGSNIEVFVDNLLENDVHNHETLDNANDVHNHEALDNAHHVHNHESEHNAHHTHTHIGINDIEKLIDGLLVSDKVKEDSKNVYRLLAEAEGKVHGREMSQIHFHEVGTMDAVADIVGVCMLINELDVDKIITSPICVGSGQVHCAHGILPVPAPATELILHGVPIYSGNINGELCTPTGAALLKYFTDEFTKMPEMIVGKTGYGMGKKDFEAANCVRTMLGETDSQDSNIVELCCNLDDMTAEDIGYAMEKLLEEGALDVYTMPVGMKKNRTGTMLVCMCDKNEKDRFLKLIFKHTTTIGLREYECRRYCLDREIIEQKTEYGTVHIKKSTGYGVVRRKAEYEDIKAIADKHNISFEEVRGLCN